MNSRPKKTYIIIMVGIILLTLIGIASYSFFSIGNLSISNAVNLNAISEENNMVFDTLGGEISLNVSLDNMLEGGAGTLAAENNATLTVSFQANTPYSVLCYYDIVWEWTSSDKYQAHTSGVTDNEITIQANFSGNGGYGNNYINTETDLADIVGNQNSEVVVSRAEIDSTGSLTSIVYWDLYTRFYNVNADQSALAGKNFSGKFKVANVDCKKGKAQKTLVDYIKYGAPRSGTDAITNSPWLLTSDRTGELRYAGKNPDNYISFNGELWRIIGVMPDIEYCTGTYGGASECNTTETGSLIKIIRNDTLPWSTMFDGKQSLGSSISSSGSSDWSDSQLMLMLNGTNYLKTGYDVNGNQLHTGYTTTGSTITDGVIDKSFYNPSHTYLDVGGATINRPNIASQTTGYTLLNENFTGIMSTSSLSTIATVKWDLYGTNSYTTAAEGSPSAFYNKERNINNNGTVYTNASLPENRPAYWYGKVGLMYPSDYGYATSGGSTYNRDTCLGYQMSSWNSGSYKTDCAANSYLWYTGITSTVPGAYGTNQWLLNPYTSSDYQVFYMHSSGYLEFSTASSGGIYIRPTLYLNSNVLLDGGTGTWDDPYTIGSGSKFYWFPTTQAVWNYETYQYEPVYTFPETGGAIQSRGAATGYDVHMGQDNEKYYACINYDGHEACMSQPLTQYGLSGYTIGNNFTSAQRTSGKKALLDSLNESGLNLTLSDCGADSSYIGCYLDNYSWEIYSHGYVYVFDGTNSVGCGVDSQGRGNCGD